MPIHMKINSYLIPLKVWFLVKLIILCLTLYCCDRVTNCDEIISEYVNSVYKKHIYGGFALLKLMSGNGNIIR